MRLAPKKQKEKVPEVIGFDIETHGRKNEFVCASLVSNKYPEGLRFTRKDLLIEELKRRCYRGCYISATNLSFDFMGTFFGGEDIQNFNMCFQNGSSMLMFATTYVENGKFTTNPTQKKHKLTFIDTLNYAGLSVEKMGKILRMPKLEKPPFLGLKPTNKEQWAEMWKYNIRDSRISKQFLDFLFEGFIKLGADVKMTIASTSMSRFRNVNLKETFYQLPKELLLEQFKSYYGGRTEAFGRGKIENMNYYDINSLYPSVMRDNIFPHPNSVRVSHKNTDFYYKNFEGLTHCRVMCPDMRYPILPLNTGEKLIFPTGEFSGWFTNVEIRHAVNFGYQILDVYKSQYFKKTCSPFAEFVNEMYALRMEYKKDDNPMEYVVKIMMNSLYGKFGQKFEGRDNIVTISQLKDMKQFDGKIERVGDSPFFRTKSDCQPAPFCIPIWASYITAYARLKLWDYINTYRAVYCDTDSIITTEKVPTSMELGMMKHEYTIAEGLIVKPKFYGFRGVEYKNNKCFNAEAVKIKGVRLKLTYDMFTEKCSNTNEDNKFCVKYDKFLKFKEAMRRKLIPNEIIEINKELSVEDDKRYWEYSFNENSYQDSIPHKIKEGFIKDERVLIYANSSGAKVGEK